MQGEWLQVDKSIDQNCSSPDARTVCPYESTNKSTQLVKTTDQVQTAAEDWEYVHIWVDSTNCNAETQYKQ